MHKRNEFTDATKLAILRRSVCTVVCANCLRCFALKEVEFDHIVADVHKGGNSAENGQPLCGKCHQKKRTGISNQTRKLSVSSESAKALGAPNENVSRADHFRKRLAPSDDVDDWRTK